MSRTLPFKTNMILMFPNASVILDIFGDTRKAIKLFVQQHGTLHSFISSALPSLGFNEAAMYFVGGAGAFAGLETNTVYAFRAALTKLLAAFGCTTMADCVEWYEQSPEWASIRKRAMSSRDGLHHAYPPVGIKVLLQAMMSLASTGTDRDAGLEFLDGLPAADATTLYLCNVAQIMHVCPRTLVRRILPSFPEL